MRNEQPKSPEDLELLLIDLGIDVISVDKVSIKFWFKGNPVEYFFKKQWLSGKGVKDGRGWNNLIRQINPQKPNKNVVNGVDCSIVSKNRKVMYHVVDGNLQECEIPNLRKDIDLTTGEKIIQNKPDDPRNEPVWFYPTDSLKEPIRIR